MGLQSQLFGGVPELEAAAVRNDAHITPGAVGSHVAKIQLALNRVDGATIDPGELVGQCYGPSTANAVLAYKQKRNIINFSYQTTADNIVGIMTITALDQEMLAAEQVTQYSDQTIRCEFTKRGRPGYPV
jgi:peptidoglycan hydrolase-like protein with peptidoglycan-binding domain